LLKASHYDCLLLDLMLPDYDGLELFKTLRQHYSLPVIMLTAKGDATDRVLGLEMGADDYLPKPFEPRELAARIKAVMRRGNLKDAIRNIHRFAELEIDEDERVLRINDEIKTLTAYQFDLLLCLVKRAGRVISREQLAELVRGRGIAYDPTFDRSIDIHIGKIRAAIEIDAKNPRFLVTIRSVGYVFNKVLT
jgi:DNA-binding response OmpR family regulator